MADRVYLGVLAARRSSANRPYQAQTTYFRRLVAEAEGIGVRVFVFGPRDVLWSKRRIRGWTLHKGKWTKRVFPFPVAIYDRVSPKGRADLAGVHVARQRFKRLRVPLFNTRLGSKWRMHKLFAKSPILKEALPPTRVCNAKSLQAMLAKHGEVYVKPSQGGQGKGVAWVKRIGGGYVYRQKAAKGTRAGRAKSVGGLLARIGARRRLHLVQKAIPIPRYHGRAFDIRILVQRGIDGEWRVTGLVSRLGARKARVTNIHAGGSAKPLEMTLEGVGATERQREAVIERCRELALETAAVIARASGHVAELGVDIAIDDAFNCWLLEANSRTGRISFHRAGLVEAGKAADRGPAEYAWFLAHRTKKAKSTFPAPAP